MIEDRQTATIMIIDDTPANLRLLESRIPTGESYPPPITWTPSIKTKAIQ